MSPLDHLDRAVDDLAWRFGEAESTLGMSGQAIGEGRGGKAVFDDEAQWRKMEDMLTERRMKAIARLRLVDAAMRNCPEHARTFALAFVPFGIARCGNSTKIIHEFSVGRIRLLGLAVETTAARQSIANSKATSTAQWLLDLATSTARESRALFERMRRQAQERLLPALQAYDVEAALVRDADEKARREAHDATIRAIEDEAAKSRPCGERADQRAARLVADTLRLYREAGVE